MTDVTVTTVARIIAQALGDNYDDAFTNKSEWVAERGERGGRFRDVNEPFRCDYDEAARAALASVLPAMEEAREALGNLIEQCVSCEKELTEQLYHEDFCGESLPLLGAREALATLSAAIEQVKGESDG